MRWAALATTLSQEVSEIYHMRLPESTHFDEKTSSSSPLVDCLLKDLGSERWMVASAGPLGRNAMVQPVRE